MPYQPWDPWQVQSSYWAQNAGGMGAYDADTGMPVHRVGAYPDSGMIGGSGGSPGVGGGRTGRYYGAGPESQEDFAELAMMKDIIDKTMGRGQYDRTMTGGDGYFDPGRGGLGGGPLKKGGYSFGLGYGPGIQDLRYVNFESDPNPVSMYDHPYNPEMWDDQNFGPGKFRGPGGIQDYTEYDSGRRRGRLFDSGRNEHIRNTVGRLAQLMNDMNRRRNRRGR